MPLPREGAVGGEKMLFGAQALQSMWQSLEESKTSDAVQLDGTFRHLFLQAEQHKKLDKWVGVLCERQPKAKA